MAKSPSPKNEDSGREPRLNASAWIAVALDALAQGGVEAVRVEPLARTLGVTKGSFYYHFKDRSDLLDALLDYWRQQSTLKIIERIHRLDIKPIDKLRRLIELPIRRRKPTRNVSVELAIRLWARSDPKAKRAVEEIDFQRLTHIRDLVKAGGLIEAREAEGRAFLIYAYMQAEALMPANLTAQTQSACDRLLDSDPKPPRRRT